MVYLKKLKEVVKMSVIFSDGVEAYSGRVLETYERNGYNDSDFIAIVWDDEKQGMKEVEYDTTRCGGYGSAIVDATPDIIRKAHRIMYWFNLCRIKRRVAEAALEPAKGKLVRVERGRKYKGLTGKIFWIGVNQFKRDSYNAGIESDDGSKFFVPIEYVKVLDAGDYMEITPLEMKRRAARNSRYEFRMI